MQPELFDGSQPLDTVIFHGSLVNVIEGYLGSKQRGNDVSGDDWTALEPRYSSSANRH